MIPFFPKQFSKMAVLLYLLSLASVSLVCYKYSMGLDFILIGIAWVLLFFLLSHRYTKRWASLHDAAFIRKIFFTALILRLIWVAFSYFYFIVKTGIPFEFKSKDALSYHNAAVWFTEIGWSDAWDYLSSRSRGDVGYPLYLYILYSLIGPNIFLTRVIKCLLSAWMCILVYKLAKRNLGEEVGRMAGVFCCLMPNLILYCGLHLKETEMMFLMVACLERADMMLRRNTLKFWDVVLVLLLLGSLFFFRNVLGVAMGFAIFTSIVFTSSKLVGGWNRFVLIVWALVALGVFAGGTIANEVKGNWNGRSSNQALKRETQVRKGYDWARYATGTVMAPMIFVLPFPTMVDVDEQYNQQLVSGGNYVRVFLGIFVLIALYSALFVKRNWRNLSLLGSFEVAYLGIVAFSGFANSERFLLPGVPVLMIMAAYGVSLVSRKNYRWVKMWYWVVPLMIFGWAYFKLGTRGLA